MGIQLSVYEIHCFIAFIICYNSSDTCCICLWRSRVEEHIKSVLRTILSFLSLINNLEWLPHSSSNYLYLTFVKSFQILNMVKAREKFKILVNQKCCRFNFFLPYFSLLIFLILFISIVFPHSSKIFNILRPPFHFWTIFDANLYCPEIPLCSNVLHPPLRTLFLPPNTFASFRC